MSPQLTSPDLVGRAEETRHLAGAFHNAPATVLLGGEAGVGKSRLVEEFIATVDAHVLRGGCVELDGLPFAPFVAALRGHPLLPQEKIALAPLLPGLAEPTATTDEARPRLFEGVLSWLGRLSARRPVLLVVEDAHWADRSSRDLLDFLVRNQKAVPGLVVIVTYRSDELLRAHPVRPLLAELSRVPRVRRFELERLSAKEVRAQMAGILGHEPDPATARAVFARSEGNPLFVEALLDGAAEASLEELLASRVDRLDPDAAAVVRAAAVAGTRVSHAVLSAVVDTTAVRSTVDGGVLVPTDDGYAFRHALIRDVVYRRLLPGERVDLHAAYAKALPVDRAAELAHHHFAAGDPGSAVTAAWRAARQARDSLAFAEQLAMLDRVLDLWSHAEHLGVDRATVLETAGEAACRAGEPERGVALTSELLALLDRDREVVRFAAVLEQRARARPLPHALDDHRAAVALAPENHPIRGFLLNSLAARLMEVPLPDEAERVATEALGAAHHAGDDPSEAAALITLAVLAARRGDLDAQLPRLAKARDIAERVAAHRVHLRSLHCESSLAHAYGRLDRAETLARRGLRAAREIGLVRASGAVHAIDLAAALVAAGRWDEAKETVDHALDHAPPAAQHAQLLCLCAVVDLRRGDVGRAGHALGQAKALAERVTFGQDPLALVRLDVEFRLATGGDAATPVREALERTDLDHLSRFAWPLLVLGRRAGLHPAPIRVVGPVQEAWAHTFHERWPEAVEAWAALGQPYRLARNLLGLATTTSGATRAEALRTAAALADGLRAVPLRAEIADLARRARVPLTGEGPAEQAKLGLTARETQILRLVADGLGNREIGEKLFISAKTASVHVSNILGKLGVANRVEAAAAAHRLRLFD
ncbi:AAA family ATPase [Actinosynnema sp. NPDC020468]|uniref:helix-turn-helix transcriptional regulator n=1 Tax=Actinosynnema sp. NPDC020468 TaxID=3154488 RepID=UPI0033D97F5A